MKTRLWTRPRGTLRNDRQQESAKADGCFIWVVKTPYSRLNVRMGGR